MKRLFKKGQRVRSKSTGRVMEVLNYFQNKSKTMVKCIWFDLEAKEIRTGTYDENKLLKAS